MHLETQHKGIVRNLTNFGLFIELEEGIDGLVHVSDLSWTREDQASFRICEGW